MRQPPLHAWRALRGTARPLTGGLINDTFVVGDPPVGVIQRLHPVFGAAVNEDIDAVTKHLAEQGMVTPRLMRTDGGDAFVEQDGIWRALTWVDGVTHHKLDDVALAAEAGRLVARWHTATDTLDHSFAFSRPLAHDTRHHMSVLLKALEGHREHPLLDQVRPLAHGILGDWASWSGRLDHPTRVCHGDLKISNLHFDQDGRGICLLDLDTMGQLSLDVELGDAWRSWCNPAAEDSDETRFDLALFEASALSYLDERDVDAATRASLPQGVQRICLELSARFAADALNEDYFGWDADRFPSRGHHNLLRAQGQFALARSVKAQLPEMRRILDR
jgi:Ser/Thr protein kinase RdoA (MazF antagonist)